MRQVGLEIGHHTLLYWALIVACLFQVQVTPETNPLSRTQLYRLQQRMIGKVDTCIAFSTSNQKVITEHYAQKKDAPEADQELLPGDRVWWSRGQDWGPFDVLLRARVSGISP